jgi:hypothetical protein
VSDVDHDNDLDVVVSAVLSREVVGIWLNDGGGRFEATDVRQFASHTPLLQSISTPDLPVAPAAVGVPSRRAPDALTALVRTPFVRSHRRVLNVDPDLLHTAPHTTAAAPRAPPFQSA